MNCELSFFLDTRRKLKNDLYPLKLRLYSDRTYHAFKTGINLTIEQYSALDLALQNESLLKTLFEVLNIKERVSKYVGEVNELKLEKVRQMVDNTAQHHSLPSSSSDTENVFDWFDKKINELEDNVQYGNAECYSATRNVYERLLKSVNLPFSFFSVKRLKEMEQHLLEKGSSISTIGKHARNLRTIFNLAIEQKAISKDLYPFTRNGYVIPATKKGKKSLSSDPLALLLNYKPCSRNEMEAILYFTFSYFGNGMNLKDIATIKHRDNVCGIITYYRKKTRHTGSEFRTIKVIVTEEMKAVIDCWSDPNNIYVFPILQPELTEKQVNRKVHTKNKQLNDALKNISKKLKLGVQVTLGMSRHTFANALKQQGIATDHISEMLGHSTVETTKHYLSTLGEISSDYVNKLKEFARRKDQ